MTIALVIPCFNEEPRLPRTLEHIESFMRGTPGLIPQIIIVDDGSTDRTSEIVESWRGRLPIEIARLPRNSGKGAALRAGVPLAKQDAVLLYDADAATPITELPRFCSALGDGADIVIGSRLRDGPGHTVRMQPHRRLIGRLYFWLTAPLIPGVHDAACGCKLLRRETARELFAAQHINRFAYDIEILSMAIARGKKVVEVPVSWTAVPISKVRLLRDGPEMFMRVLQLYGSRVWWWITSRGGNQ